MFTGFGAAVVLVTAVQHTAARQRTNASMAAYVHPYYPLGLELPGVQPLVMPFEKILAVFFTACGMALAAGWYMTGVLLSLALCRPACLWLQAWLILIGLLSSRPRLFHLWWPYTLRSCCCCGRCAGAAVLQDVPSSCLLASAAWHAGSCAQALFICLLKVRRRSISNSLRHAAAAASSSSIQGNNA